MCFTGHPPEIIRERSLSLDFLFDIYYVEFLYIMEPDKGDVLMMNVIKCMCIDSYYCILVVGQVVSWMGILATSFYLTKKFLFIEDEYES